MDEASALVRALCSSCTYCVSGACSICQCLNMLVVHGHGRGKRLGICFVLKLRALCAVSLQDASMFEYGYCVWVWTRHVPRYVPSVHPMCYGHCCMHD